jgi:hypothetical protein
VDNSQLMSLTEGGTEMGGELEEIHGILASTYFVISLPLRVRFRIIVQYVTLEALTFLNTQI